MSDTAKSSVTPSPRRWLRRSAMAAVALFTLLVVVYLVATSAMFLKGFVLPRVAKALGAEVSLEDADIHPFSKMVLRGLKVRTTGEPLFQAGEIRASYNLREIIGGKMVVEEAVIVGATLHLEQNADGTFNFSPIVKVTTANEAKPAAPAKTSPPPQLDIKRLALENATVQFSKTDQAGQRTQVEVTGINFAISDLKNASTAKIALAASAKLDLPGAKGRNQMAATVKVDLSTGLDAALQPQSAGGNISFEVNQATGDFKDLVALSTALAVDWTPKEIKQCSLRVAQAGKPLSEVRVSGALDVTKLEGKLRLDVLGIDHNVLNLVGAPLGIDFGATTVNATTQIELANHAQVISTGGQLNIGKLSLTQKGQTTPPLDLKFDFQTTVDQAKQTALVQSFTLDGTQHSRPLLNARLRQPMNLTWSTNANAVGDSAFDLNVTNLDLADLRAFTGKTVNGGKIDVALHVTAKNAGQKLELDLNTKLAGLLLTLGTNALPETAIALKGRASLSNFSQLNLTEASVIVGDKENTLAALAMADLSASGSVNLKTQEADLQTRVTANLPRVATFLNLHEPQLREGSITLTSHLGQKISIANARTNSLQTVSGKITLTNFSVHLPNLALPKLTALVDYDMELRDGQTANLKQFTLSLTPTPRAQNQLALTGTVDFSNPKALTTALKLTADSLDITPYYDLFDNSTKTNRPTPPTSAKDAEDPAAMILPVKNSSFEINLGKLFLREVSISNFIAIAKVDGGHVQLQPLKLSLNGAPVSANADINLGVPGWTYNVGLKADKIAIAPLANSFSPNYQGQANGDLYADIQLQGAGTTGASLKRALAGHAFLNFTNANIQIVGPKIQNVLRPISLILNLPELLQSPINYLTADIGAGNGQIELKHFIAHSAALIAESHGTIQLAEGLTNSPLNLPLEISLPNTLAKKFLMPSALSGSSSYSKLPTFVTIKGTLGKPDADIDKLKLAGTSALGIAGAVGGRAGEAIKGGAGMVQDLGANPAKALGNLGGLLSLKPARTNALDSATTETNKTKFNPFNLLPSPKK